MIVVTRAGRTLLLMLFAGAGTILLVRLAPGFFSDSREMDAKYATAVRSEMQAQNNQQRAVSVIAMQEVKSWLNGDLGQSRQYDVPVVQLIGARARVSALLLAQGIFLGWLLAACTALPLSRLPHGGLLWGAPFTLLLSIPTAAMATACILSDSGGPVCDLNGFKKINDRYGHLAGDKVLKIFAGLMRKACREYDYAARMGGDEFVIVAPNMTPASVSERATLLNAMAQEASREVCGADMLSVSLGAVFYPQDGSDTEHLLAEADRKMYAAKQRHYQPGEEPSAALVQHLHLVPMN
jgi:diguanylate cyclase (GGDEF)-like protein